MASPAVVGTPTETAVSTASTSHVVNLPSGTTGNLLVAVMSKGSAGTTPSVNELAGWTELLDEAIVLGLYVAYRVCDGTEGANTTFTLSSATRGAWIVYEISGHSVPAQAPQIGTTATGTSVNPNPPSVSVTGGSKDILAIAMFGMAGEQADDDTLVTTFPTNYTLGQAEITCGVAGTNLGGMCGAAARQVTTATEDPGTFTAIDNAAWRAQTIVIHPDTSIQKTLTAATSTEVAGGTIDWAISSAAETDAAQTLTTSGPIVKTLTPGLETGAAQALSISKALSLTAATETDAAQTLATSGPILKTLTAATSTETAGGLVAWAIISAVETDAAQALSVSTGTKTLTPATETDSVAGLYAFRVTAAAEADLAETVGFTQGGGPVALTAATETDAAQSVSFTKTIFVSVVAATSAEQAQTLSVGGPKVLTPTAETDAAQALSATKTIFKALVAATCAEAAQAVTAAHTRALTAAASTEAAQALARSKQAQLVAALETDLAQALALTVFKSLVAAPEQDAAVELSLPGGEGYPGSFDSSANGRSGARTTAGVFTSANRGKIGVE